jgi:hypothetical protein
MQPKHGYLIYKDGRGYYRDKAQGYTLQADDAGRFSLEDAINSSHPNGPDGPRDGIRYIHESTIPRGSDCEKEIQISDLTRERNSLRQAQEALCQELAAAHKKIGDLEIEVGAINKAIEITGRIPVNMKGDL